MVKVTREGDWYAVELGGVRVRLAGEDADELVKQLVATTPRGVSALWWMFWLDHVHPGLDISAAAKAAREYLAAPPGNEPDRYRADYLLARLVLAVEGKHPDTMPSCNECGGVGYLHDPSRHGVETRDNEPCDCPACKGWGGPDPLRKLAEMSGV